MTDHELPPEIMAGTDLRGNEYGWSVASFPDALAQAETLGYACVGGQFQFRLPDATCEMYWIKADSTDREPEETWSAYCKRSCREVRQRFDRLVWETDFKKEAAGWEPADQALAQGTELMKMLVFIAYFDTEHEWCARNKA